MDTQNTPHRTVPQTDSITKIGGGYPDKLVIFKITASPYWWVRYYTQKKILKKSTKTDNKTIAIAFAKRFYEDILLRERNLLPLGSSPSFERVARELLEEQKNLIERGERNNKINVNDKSKLDKDILPYFKGMNVKDVTYKHLDAFVSKLSERNLKPSTINNHLNLIHKILSLSLRENLLDRIPQFPRVKREDSPRGWFNKDEYTLLRKKTSEVIKEKKNLRGHVIDDEMRFLITFLTNSFLRPSDIKELRNRNVQIVEGGEHTFLRIQTEHSKTVNTPIVTMEDCVGIYKDLIEYQKSMGRPYGKDDFVFFPHLKGQGKDGSNTKDKNKNANRDYALQTMRRQFDYILEQSELKTAPSGEPRTLYSLRHTAIMFRLTLGGDIDLLTLARNARTSVAMIERFYAKPLQAEMNVGKLQSMRKGKSQTKRKVNGTKGDIRKGDA